jgi:translation elongation factor EF-G
VEGVAMRVTLFNGSFHVVDLHDWNFKKAGFLALKAAVEKAHPIMLKLDEK